MQYRQIMTGITRLGLLASVSFLLADPSLAADGRVVDGQALAKQRQCLGCHQVDARRVGPPFRAIAQRFRDQPQAAQYLAQTMRRGSSRQWGAIPMPAQTRLSDADAMRLAQWILSLPDGPAQP
ncbi:c-type cytochrome [Castellaniella sp.]|uniref:c-type cytochrome n=1 Tax=Castellaniella sp. TaxID=1955812 RepID=UPI002AFE67C7|nr:c-type cytochrome [Castellaniella sp.]